MLRLFENSDWKGVYNHRNQIFLMENFFDGKVFDGKILMKNFIIIFYANQ